MAVKQSEPVITIIEAIVALLLVAAGTMLAIIARACWIWENETKETKVKAAVGDAASLSRTQRFINGLKNWLKKEWEKDWDNQTILLVTSVTCIMMPYIFRRETWADHVFIFLGLFAFYKVIVSYTHDKKGFFDFPNAWKVMCVLIVVLGSLAGLLLVSNAWVAVSWVENGSDLIDSIVEGVIQLLDYLEDHGYINPNDLWRRAPIPDPLPPFPDQPDPPHRGSEVIHVEYSAWV